MGNTRFAPSPNGFIHLGHVFMALVNDAEAKKHNGNFLIRVHDKEIFWAGEGYIQKVVDNMVEVFTQFNIPCDNIIWESHEAKVIDHLWESFGLKESIHQVHMKHPMQGGWHDFYKINHANVFYGVVSDYINQCDPVIRGEDLRPENHQYWYFCDMMQLPKPEMVYVPRITINTDKVSKSAGTPSASFMIKECGLDYIIGRMKDYLLLDPDGGFVVDNIDVDNLNLEL